MCPLWPFHYLFMYVITLGPLWFISFRAVGTAAEAVTTNWKWNVEFVTKEPNLKLNMGDSITMETKVNMTELRQHFPEIGSDDGIEIYVENSEIVSVYPSKLSLYNESESQVFLNDSGNCTLHSEDESCGKFNITGKFLGRTKLRVRRMISMDKAIVSDSHVNVTVIRESRNVDKAFTYSVIALVAIICINMGAAVDMPTIKRTMKTPIGPAIGLFCQFVIMPLLAFGLAKLIFTGSIAGLQLGLFLTGCSPGGGASNIWTLTLGGNLDLSITMTTISTFCAFFMMPFWMVTLGSVLFKEADLKVPYMKLIQFAVILVVPLAIGIGIQKWAPQLARFLKRILRPFAIFLIVFIVVFAIFTNWYLFKLFTWEILLAGMLLPWLGYFLGGGMALLCRQDWKDIIAIGVETGVQNTGLAIFALRVSLEQPEADLTTVIPVAVALMTPVVPTAIFLYKKIRDRSAQGYSIEDSKVQEPLNMNSPI